MNNKPADELLAGLRDWDVRSEPGLGLDGKYSVILTFDDLATIDTWLEILTRHNGGK